MESRMLKFSHKKKMQFFLLAGILFLAWPFLTWAAMQSSTYKINSDTVNGGGDLSRSATYNLGDTLGEQAIGESRSSSYIGQAGFWNMISGGTQLGLTCQASDVYMADYTLGDANNYNKYLFSTSEKCTVTDNADAPWTLTISSTNMTSARNNLSNTNVKLVTNGDAATEDTLISPTTGISESTGENSLNTTRNIGIGDTSASGIYEVRPTVKLTDLNSLFSEQMTGILTITLQ
jgi:hypothetical protein